MIYLKCILNLFSNTHTQNFSGFGPSFLRDAVFGCTVRPKIFNWSKPVRAIFCLAKVTLAFNEHHYNASCTNDHYKPLSMALAVLSFLERGCSNFLQNLQQTTNLQQSTASSKESFTEAPSLSQLVGAQLPTVSHTH